MSATSRSRRRVAVASGEVIMQLATWQLIRDRKTAKGDVREVARLAGIMAAKQTANLIPLCHPLPLDSVEIDFLEPKIDIQRRRSALGIRATVRVTARTGVEMEALTATSVAALTIYDMCKAVDRAMVIGQQSASKKNPAAAAGISAVRCSAEAYVSLASPKLAATHNPHHCYGRHIRMPCFVARIPIARRRPQPIFDWSSFGDRYAPVVFPVRVVCMSESHDLLDRRPNSNPAAAPWTSGATHDAPPATAGKSDKLEELLGRIAKLTGQESFRLTRPFRRAITSSAKPMPAAWR